ncbi:hypothetical protein [Streptomyces sp. NPDC059009]|uniref:hypothetical protein n=1 Tax=Streptomyces sp. NPDC059009 TaxID=3346694 RepID=UPI0036BD6CB7
MTDPVPVEVDRALAKRFAELASAKEAAASWARHVKQLRASILEELGYDPDDQRPPSRMAVDSSGTPLFVVDVTYRGDFDRKGLAAKHPAIYAEFETLTPVKQIKPPDT